MPIFATVYYNGLELFPMHDGRYFDEKEISWKSDSNVIFIFAFSIFLYDVKEWVRQEIYEL